jgi:tyrosine-protein phosphatase YwqE
VLSFFKKQNQPGNIPLKTDIHSHLLAGLDDGVKNWDESEQIVRCLREIGIERIITTPHIMSDTYPNQPAIILQKTNELRQLLAQKKIQIDLQAAAEYYLDEIVYSKLIQKEPLLTFGERYLLFETNFISEPYLLKDFIFQGSAQGYRLVLAHPERYGYMTLAKAEDLRNRGVLFQVNTLSIIGYYSKPIQKFAHQLIERRWVEFLGSDCHNPLQAIALQEAMSNKYVQKALSLPLLNNTI